MLASFIFLNPFTMIIGGALIASPIIIHLINRMRFKRIRWAAMEFLLKAQKKSRRRMIIEQLILLLLRILLVLLIALLLSRLIEKKETPSGDTDKEKPAPKTTLHLIILDDSPSMADRWKEEEGAEKGQEVQPFVRARKIVNEAIVDAVKDDNIGQHEIMIIHTSGREENFKLLTEQSRVDIEKHVAEKYKALDIHNELLPALNRAKKIFEENAKLNLALHVVSDFRSSDWNDAHKDALGELFAHFETALVQVKLHDAASPRREGDKVAASNNLAIVDFRPDSRVAIKDAPVEFSVTVGNYGTSNSRALVKLKVNNNDELQGTVPFDDIPPGQTTTRRVSFPLRRTAPKKAADQDEKSKFDGFNLVSAHLENQAGGLAIDDVRYTVVEVRDKISILIVDNDITARTLVREDGRDEYQLKKEAEAFYLWKLLKDTYSGFDVAVRTAGELEKFNLAPYSAVVLCNIPVLSPLAVQKLEEFLNAGGGVGFFMGPAIRDPKFYNEVLWKGGAGMFPAPLKEIANASATIEQLTQIQFDERLSPYKKLVIRDDAREHPALERLFGDARGGSSVDKSYENSFYGVSFPRYYVVDRPKWKPGPETQTLIYLANKRSIADFEKDARDLVRKLREIADESSERQKLQQQLAEATDPAVKERIVKELDQLKANKERYAKYQKVLAEYTTAILNSVGKYDTPLYHLVLWIESMLKDPAVQDQRPSMIEFWQDPALQDLKREFQQLLERIKYGDPFYIAKQYKRGRVLAFMGSAGMSGLEAGFWNPLNSVLGQPYFPPLMKDSLQRYLCSNTPFAEATAALGASAPPGYLAVIGGLAQPAAETVSSDYYLPLGKPFAFELAAADYLPEVKVIHISNNDKPIVEEDKVTFRPVPIKQKPDANETQISWRFTDGDQAGVYLFEFTPKTIDSGKKDPTSDLRAVAYNFDTDAESKLARADTRYVTDLAKVKKFEDKDSSLDKKSKEPVKQFNDTEDHLGFSKSHWLFLGMLVILILEQAWAVRLSFHVRENAGPILPTGPVRGPITV